MLLIQLCITSIINGQAYYSGRQTDFEVQYFLKEKGITSNELLSLKFTGRKWSHSDKQMEAIWIYNTKHKTKKMFANQFSIGWRQTDTTGFIEDQYSAWIHPPRHNQYSMTELAPFPNIEKDKLKTEGYSHMLKIGDGWGKWSNTDIQFNYVVKDIKAELQDTIYIVTANSEFESKINNCEFIYSNENGFVSLKYEFYNGDKLSINKKKN